ncbi:MAG: RIP metalloprotease RseP [Thiobacillaceae bacterium]
MGILHTIIWFLIALGVLVTVHEFGHYLAARLAGVKVLRFSVGFGQPLFMRRMGRDQTEWAVCALPLGGYVKMLDEREGEVAAAEQHRSFNRASVWRRIAIVAAGPAANFILAVLLYGVLFVHGIPALKPVIGQPLDKTPAALAGLVAGDEITRVNDVEIQSFQDLRLALLRAGVAHESVALQLKDGRTAQLDVSAMQTDDLERDTLEPLGITRIDPDIPAVVGQVVAGGVAAKAGLAAGDRLLSVNGAALTSWQGWVKWVRAHPGKALSVDYERHGVVRTVSLTPVATQEGAQKVGKIGAAPQVNEALLADYLTEVRYGPLDALWQGAKKTWEMSAFTLEMMGRMVLGQVSIKNLSGPLTIADFAGQSATQGWVSFVGFLALVSVSLGVLNLLPVPVLDGGHLMYYVSEVFTGRPVSERVMELGSRVGMGLLLLLTSFALYNDLQRLLPG